MTVDLLGQGRPDDPDDLVPAVLSCDAMRLAVSPETRRGASSSEVEASRVTVADGDAVVEGTAVPGEVRYGPDEEHPSAEAATLGRALMAAIGDPQAGGRCLSIEEAHDVAADVLAELGLTPWSIQTASDDRDDECATFSVIEDDEGIRVLTGMHPDVKGVLDAFFELSLDECLDPASAVDMRTARLDEIGHTDFVVKVDSMLGGPCDRMEEIRAHADAGCVFYVASGVEADGTRVYFLRGE